MPDRKRPDNPAALSSNRASRAVQLESTTEFSTEDLAKAPAANPVSMNPAELANLRNNGEK